MVRWRLNHHYHDHPQHVEWTRLALRESFARGPGYVQWVLYDDEIPLTHLCDVVPVGTELAPVV